MKLLIIIPAYNEAESIERVVDDLTENYPAYDYVVINDGSTDATGDICLRRGYHVVSQPVNLGLTAAVQTGMRYAHERGYDCALQFDADGQHRPEFIAPMLEKLGEGYDIVIGSRFVGKKRGGGARMAGSRLLSGLIRLTTGHTIHDPTSGMRMVDARIIEEFATELNYAPEPDTISYLIKRGARFAEVPVEMAERTAGTSYFTFTRSLGYMLQMCVSILLMQWVRKRRTHNRLPKEGE